MAKLKRTSVNGDIEMSNPSGKLEDIISIIYPIGSIYLSVTDVNPSLLFPGTQWEQFAIGKTLVGYSGGYYTSEIEGSNQMIDSSTSLLAIGGEEKHQLSSSELPYHNHNINIQHSDGASVPGEECLTSGLQVGGRKRAYTVGMYGLTSWNQPHNNCMPFIVVSMWKRIK